MPNNNRNRNGSGSGSGGGNGRNNRNQYKRGWDDEIRGNRCGVCMPYRDPWIIMALIGSVFAMSVSWVWWLSWLFCLASFASVHCLLCCRDTKIGILRTAALACLCAVYNFGLAIFVRTAWDDEETVFICLPFSMATLTRDEYVVKALADDDIYIENARDLCLEGFFGGVAVLCGFLWISVAACAFAFVWRGNHASWEDKYSPTTAVAVEVELGRLPNGDGGDGDGDGGDGDGDGDDDADSIADIIAAIAEAESGTAATPQLAVVAAADTEYDTTGTTMVTATAVTAAPIVVTAVPVPQGTEDRTE